MKAVGLGQITCTTKFEQLEKQYKRARYIYIAIGYNADFSTCQWLPGEE